MHACNRWWAVMDSNHFDTRTTTSLTDRNESPMPSVEGHGNKACLSQIMQDFEFRKTRAHSLS
jgi:hypothetical protein